MVCAYGMAEATLGVSFAPLGVGMQVDCVDADELETRRRAVVAVPSAPHVREFPRLGPPLPGMQVRVVTDDGHEVGERVVGRLQVRGSSVTRQYLTTTGPRATQDADGWLDTGDEGYLVAGEVVVCGRRKDVIVMGGRNIYPIDIERAAQRVEGVRPGNVAAVRLTAAGRRESFAVAVESGRAGDAEAERILRKEVAARVVDAVGLRPGAVVVLPPAALPKTPSGKLRRAALRARIAEHLP
jgi:fatty-acyl-CoA synthase